MLLLFLKSENFLSFLLFVFLVIWDNIARYNSKTQVSYFCADYPISFDFALGFR